MSPGSSSPAQPKSPILGSASCHFIGAGVAAVVNFPLWKAATIGQSGFQVPGQTVMQKLLLPFQPPYKGVMATLFGMTWARAAIFYGSDRFKQTMLTAGASNTVATWTPPIVLSTAVQVINQPIVRATITIQDPACQYKNTVSALVAISRQRGPAALWHGTTPSVLKTVPKYCVAIAVKDKMDQSLAPVTFAKDDPRHKNAQLWRAAKKSVAAGVAGAALTNPLDVIRNEMFKTEMPLIATVRSLWTSYGVHFLFRGMGQNLTAVAMPVAMTIFLTDALLAATHPS